MRRKLSDNKIKGLIQDYLTGNFTRHELSLIYNISTNTVDRYLKGVHKPFKYDAMNRAISLDYLKEHGVEMASPPEHIMDLVPGRELEEQWTSKQYRCPHCGHFRTSRQLVPHMVKYHQRYDLEYLLEELEEQYYE